MPTTTIQPSTKDNYIVSNVPDENQGTNVVIKVLNLAAAIQRTLITFDVSAYAAGSSNITSAILKLYYSSDNGDTNPSGLQVNVYKMLRTTWEEGNGTSNADSNWNDYITDTTWGTAGCSNTTSDYTTTNMASTVFPGSAGAWMEWDITEIVKDAIDNVSSKVNLLVRFNDESLGAGYSNVSFHSRHYGSTAGEQALRPKLEISTGSPAILRATKDNYMQANAPDDNNGASTTFLNLYANASAYRGLITFNASSLPVGAEITSATLSLYYYNKITDPNGRAVVIYKLRRNDWEEGTQDGALGDSSWSQYKSGVDWTAGGAGDTTNDIDTSLTASTNYPASYGWVDWDVKDIVEDAIANVSGIVNMRLSFGTESGNYYAYNYPRHYTGNTALRPKLTIEYTIVGFTPLSILATIPSMTATFQRAVTAAFTPLSVLITIPSTAASWIYAAIASFTSSVINFTISAMTAVGVVFPPQVKPIARITKNFISAAIKKTKILLRVDKTTPTIK